VRDERGICVDTRIKGNSVYSPPFSDRVAVRYGNQREVNCQSSFCNCCGSW